MRSDVVLCPGQPQQAIEASNEQRLVSTALYDNYSLLVVAT